jgi:hypothetical protein
MKKFLKVFVIVFLVIFLILLIIPFAFKGRILELAKSEMNKNLNATVEFDDLRLSLIRNFPNLSVTLTDMSVVGVDRFAGDTLVSFRSFRTVVDLKSIFRGDEITVRSVLLDRPRVKAIYADDGSVNWDIMKDADDAGVTEEETEFRIGLRKFEVRNGRVEYIDVPTEVLAIVDHLNLQMKGDLTQELTSLDIIASSRVFNVWFEEFRYIHDARLDVATLLDADLNDFRFTIKESNIKLNDLEMGMDGFVAMPEDDIDMDLNFYSKRTDFKSILSLVPAVYMTGFEELETRGSLDLKGFVKGTVSDETMPSGGLDIIIENGWFSYPELPGSLENMAMNLNLYYDGVDDDKTTVDLNHFNIEMAGNPFSMNMSIRTPVSDMAIKAAFNGKIDFTSLADIIPLEGIFIRGLLESDIFMAGNMSDIENERYEQFNAGGNLRLTAFQYSDEDLPAGISIPRALLDFSPRYVQLSELDMLMGSSDFSMSGRLENFIPFAFNDGTLEGNLVFTSSLIDLNELLAGEETAEADTVPLSIIEIPGNIDFTLTSAIERILYDNMEIDKLQGRVIVRESRMIMEGVSMAMLEGTVRMNGEYNTRDMTSPFIDFAMDITNFDIPATFETFNTVRQLAPVARDVSGKVSSTLKFFAYLDDEMMPVMNSVDAHGRLRTTDVSLLRSNALDKLANALRLREDKSTDFRDVEISFNVRDGRVYVEPFETRMGPINMVVGGDQGIDQTMNYLVKMNIPRSEFGSGANQVIENLVSGAASRGLMVQPGENVSVDARITGTFSDPDISLSMMETTRSAMEQVREQVRTRAVEEIERRVDQVEDRAREEKPPVMPRI